MSLFGRFLPNLVTNMHRTVCNTLLPKSNFHILTQDISKGQLAPAGLFNISVRNYIRNNFPRPSERKRIKRHGYWKRMSTPAGRRIIMRRILKGKHVYTH